VYICFCTFMVDTTMVDWHYIWLQDPLSKILSWTYRNCISARDNGLTLDDVSSTTHSVD
jgi:hypothetical protein